MGFEVVQGSPQTIWAPIVDSDTIYVGQLVKFAKGTEGVQPLADAQGAGDTTAKQVVLGVCIGTNNKTPNFNTTYNTEYITDATPLSSTTEFVGVEGPYPKGGKVAMAKIALITPSTVVKGPVRDGGVSTAMTEATVTEPGNASAVGCTVDGIGWPNTVGDAHVGSSTIYFRTGNNKGQYRIKDNDDSTNQTWDKPLYSSVSSGDKLVAVNGLVPVGPARMALGTEALYIDGGDANSSADYFAIIVHRLDLSESGNEYCEFRFASCHFDPLRA